MILGLLFKSMAGGGRQSSIGDLKLDVLIEEEHSMESEITDHPVEAGAVIHDHVTNQPRRLKMTGFVSDAPLKDADAPLGAVPSASAYQTLEQLWIARTPFVAVTTLRQYDDMIVETLKVPRNSPEGALRFECTMKEIVLVASQNTTIPASAGSPLKAGQSPTGGGVGALTPANVVRPEADAVATDLGRPAVQEAATPPTPEVVSQESRSWAHRIFY